MMETIGVILLTVIAMAAMVVVALAVSMAWLWFFEGVKAVFAVLWAVLRCLRRLANYCR